MNTILGIDVPASFEGLPADQVSELVDRVREAGLAALRQGSLTTAQIAEAEKATAFVRDGRAYLASLAETEEEVNAQLDALEAELAAEDGGDVDPGDEPPDEDDETDDDDNGGGDGAEEEVPARRETERETTTEREAETVTAAVQYRRRRPRASQLAEHVPQDQVSLVPEQAPMIALPGNSTINAGERFESTAVLADALQQRWRQLGGGSDERLAVCRINANYPEQLHLVAGDNSENIARFGGLDIRTPQAQQAITAAVCAPAQPYYGLGCESSLARPMWASLPKYQAPRGNVSVYPSPKLEDITGGPAGSGMGIWTQEMDADPDAVKTCARIPCAEPQTYGIYGAYACMTIKNMMAMTYPELVEAYLNRLGALHASMRERALLDGVLGSVNVKNVTADAGGESASIFTIATLLELLSAAREVERFDDVTFVGWAPRWVREALRVDLARQKRTGGSAAERVAARGTVDSMFSALGVDMNWVYDTPSSGWAAPDGIDDGGEVPHLPTEAPFILAPRGNFRALDGGNLTIGVTNNNIYRDNESNRHNEFTIFMENFEGIIDFGCTSYELKITGFCPSGVQTEDGPAYACA
jgi:hypothetical protein